MKKQARIFSVSAMLSDNQFTEVEQLERICQENHPCQFKLELAYKRRLSEGEIAAKNKENEFFCYEDNQLIGYIGLFTYDGTVLEINGMVHPMYRRQGIFTTLYNRVYQTFFVSGAKELLLISDKQSESGLAFIQKVGGQYHHAEYDMRLQAENASDVYDSRIAMRETDLQDHTFTGFVEGQEIGRIRLEVIGEQGGIYGLEVCPVYRRQGYGKAFLLWGVRQLVERGCQSIFLQVDTSNDQALHLYQSSGFEVEHGMVYYEAKSQAPSSMEGS